MGNPNAFWWRWPRTNSSVDSGAGNPSMPMRFGSFGRAGDGGFGVIIGGKGADLIEIHELRMREIGTGFPNNFPPFLNIDFEVNGVVYYRKLWSSRNTPPFLVDLFTTNSNTQGSPSGDAPLRVSGGDTIRIFTDDGSRPNNSDTYQIQVDLWGIRL